MYANHAQTCWRKPLQPIVYHLPNDCLAHGHEVRHTIFAVAQERNTLLTDDCRSGALHVATCARACRASLRGDLGDGASADGAPTLTNGEAAALLQGDRGTQ